jgi:hypothetical protein
VTVEPSEPFALFYRNNSGPVFRVLQGGTLDRAAAEDATAEAFARALVSDGNESRAACHFIGQASHGRWQHSGPSPSLWALRGGDEWTSPLDTDQQAPV